MAYQTLTILDDVYENFDTIRKLALSLDYKIKPGATYPGREAKAPNYDWTSVKSSLRQFITEPVDGQCPKTPAFPQGKFRLALARDEETRIDGVHQDVQPWSAVIYLSRPEDCKGSPGIGFYRHKATGVSVATEEWEEEVFGHLKHLPHNEFKEAQFKYMRDLSNWEETQRLAMVGNRAVLLNAQCFHASLGVFGDEPANARLTQHFEFYYEDMPSYDESQPAERSSTTAST
ncbi:MAG: hypothetical protein NVS3B20_09460 [Polyangiales bacterium]